jgi:hypothetical protein
MVEPEVKAANGENGEQDAAAIAPPAAPGPFPRFLDQRLDECLELGSIDGIAPASRTRWGCDAHRCITNIITLL